MTREPYDTDLTDAEWNLLAPLVPPLLHPGPNDHNYERREIVNAILYIKRAGCSWRLLPHDLPKWQDVYYWFTRWQRDGTWARLQATFRRRVRVAEGRAPEPTAMSIDSQSVKVTDTGQPRGFDVNKKTKGKKRHIGVDTLGLLTVLLVTTASVQDRDGGRQLLAQIHRDHPTVTKVWADGAYKDLVDEAQENYGIDLEITTKIEGQKGFIPIPQRWKVERHYGWWNKDRRMSKDVERTIASSEAFADIASVKLLVHRLASLSETANGWPWKNALDTLSVIWNARAPSPSPPGLAQEIPGAAPALTITSCIFSALRPGTTTACVCSLPISPSTRSRKPSLSKPM